MWGWKCCGGVLGMRLSYWTRLVLDTWFFFFFFFWWGRGRAHWGLLGRFLGAAAWLWSGSSPLVAGSHGSLDMVFLVIQKREQF